LNIVYASYTQQATGDVGKEEDAAIETAGLVGRAFVPEIVAKKSEKR
jgi:hypothetical protein